jgi:hypothetical protein
MTEDHWAGVTLVLFLVFAVAVMEALARGIVAAWKILNDD